MWNTVSLEKFFNKKLKLIGKISIIIFKTSFNNPSHVKYGLILEIKIYKITNRQELESEPRNWRYNRNSLYVKSFILRTLALLPC